MGQSASASASGSLIGEPLRWDMKVSAAWTLKVLGSFFPCKHKNKQNQICVIFREDARLCQQSASSKLVLPGTPPR